MQSRCEHCNVLRDEIDRMHGLIVFSCKPCGRNWTETPEHVESMTRMREAVERAVAHI